MSPLARAIYAILRQRASRPEPRITYGELARQLRASSGKLKAIHHRSRPLYAALNEIGRECRRLHLPALPALVVRADTRRPGKAYFVGRCVAAEPRDRSVAAWWREVEAVKQTRYPPDLTAEEGNS